MIQALIVDDESLVRKGMRLMFPWVKYGVEIAGEAASGEKAMVFMRNQPVQLLITDITMPGMSGLELVKQAHELDPAIKVVILTCHQDFELIQEALRLGAIDYIVKTQLEELDLDDTMERILRAMRQEPLLEASPRPKPSDVRKVTEHGAGVLWIMDDEKFAALEEAVREMEDNNAPELVVALQSAREKWRRRFPMFDWEKESEAPDSAGGATVWLHKIRNDIALWLRRSGYSEDVIHAIVKAVDQLTTQTGMHVKQGEISQSVNLSKSYFSTSFRDIMRMTFSHFQQMTSIEAAKELLISTNHPVYWIAEKCGFTDQRYFSKMFKEQTGLLPSEYRQDRVMEERS